MPDTSVLAPVGPVSDQEGERARIVESGLRAVQAERDGLDALLKAMANGLRDPFCRAVDRLFGLSGRVIVTGMGKSGHIGRKVAATLASTGTPAYFVHPGEASHGDLGMICETDAVLALSWSGETSELHDIVGYCARQGVTLLAITGSAGSTLARRADIALVVPRLEEACPNGLAPTTSTTVQLALGDALAVALLERRGFTAHDFKGFHPGGKLGAMLKRVGDLMHRGDRIPLVARGTALAEALALQSSKGFGCVLVVEGDGRLAGIITDGDVRRHLLNRREAGTVDDIMTPDPVTVTADALIGAALEMMENRAISVLAVTEGQRPVGLIHVLDLLHAGAA